MKELGIKTLGEVVWIDMIDCGVTKNLALKVEWKSRTRKADPDDDELGHFSPTLHVIITTIFHRSRHAKKLLSVWKEL